MAQTLQTLLPVSSPVKITDSANLHWNMSALADVDVISLRALEVLGWIYIAAGVTVHDYRNNHAQLIQDAATFMGGISEIGNPVNSQQYSEVMTVVALNEGRDLSPTLSTDVNALLAEARDLIVLPYTTLVKILIYLRYVVSA